MNQKNNNAWILSLDNIFLDVAREFPNNSFIEENGVVPGTQNTATNPELKEFAKKIFEMQDGEYDSKKMSGTVGGCAMNTSRSANFYL